MSPPFSVIIPTYNRPARTRRAIESILQHQGVQPEEIIVVDDGSDTPFTYADAPECVRIIHLPENRGPSAARNTGLRSARSRWVTFLDSDDQLLPGTLEQRATQIGADPKVIHACGWSLRARGAQQIMGRYMPRPAQSADDHFAAIWFCPGSCIFLDRQAFLQEVGPWDETLTRYEDYDWFCRAALAGFTLQISPVVGVEIERFRALQLDKARSNVGALEQLWRRRALSGRQRRWMRAYLAYEVAAAAYFSGRYGAFAAALAKSLILKPRTTLAVLRRVAKISGS